MNRARWFNIQRARVAYERGAEETARGPIEAFFEIAARCNLRCRMCAITQDARYRASSGRPSLFTPDLFERLAVAFPTLLRAYLFGLGEPLLNPHLPEYIERLSNQGVEVWFNTNGTLIDDAVAERIARAGADRITVSIDGATAATYEAIRRGARFADVTRGIAALAAAGRKYGRLRVNLSFVAMRSNIEELPALVELAARLGTTGVHVEPLYAQQEAVLEAHYARENLGTLPASRVREILDEASRRARDLGVDLASRFVVEEEGSFDYVERAPALPIDWTCTEPWSSIWVTAAGEVRTCCINETSFGSLFESSFDAIWNGAAFRAFRRQHAERRETPEGCANCIRNGRPRCSSFFQTIEPVTYRPLALPRSAVEAPARIELPAPGDTITDPVMITGRIESQRPWELMIDDYVVPFVEATGDGGFVAISAVPFLTEGAHVLWVRSRERSGTAGWSHREIHFWRGLLARGPWTGSEVSVEPGTRAHGSGDGPPIVRTTSVAAMSLPCDAREPRVFVDRRVWPSARIERRGAAPPLLVIDARDLEPGDYDVEVWSGFAKIGEMRLERLPSLRRA